MASVGDRVGDYELEAELGQGGMATVYRAKHALLDTEHAVKVLDPELRNNANARQRFLDEAKIQAKHLDHPGIVKVTNIVATADHAALVMELVDGKSLDDEVGKVSDKPDEVRRIMIALLEAVGYAHDKGIIHRDLKPANVLLAGPKKLPKVTDFGIAKASNPGGAPHKKSTHHAARMGTLSYMSPEQVRSAKDVTVRSDIFSLGAILDELSTGKLAFDAENEFDVMAKIVNGNYEPPAKLKPGIDPTIVTVIERALQTDPAKRYHSCNEMADALRGSPASAIRIGVKPADRAPADDKKPEEKADTKKPDDKKPEIVKSQPASSGGGSSIGIVLLALLAIGGGTAALIYFKGGGGGSDNGLHAPPASAFGVWTKDLDGTGRVIARIETSEGVLRCELYAKDAPRTVANFVGLAMGKHPWYDPVAKQVAVGKPFYDGKPFHRINQSFSIQAGAPATDEYGGPGYKFADEISDAHKHAEGTLAMWSVSPNKNGSQFVIYERAMKDLDGTETVFGACSPISVVTRISSKQGAKPTITRIVIMRDDGTVPGSGSGSGIF